MLEVGQCNVGVIIRKLNIKIMNIDNFEKNLFKISLPFLFICVHSCIIIAVHLSEQAEEWFGIFALAIITFPISLLTGRFGEAINASMLVLGIINMLLGVVQYFILGLLIDLLRRRKKL